VSVTLNSTSQEAAVQIKPLTFQSSGPLSVLQFATSTRDNFAFLPSDVAIANGQVVVKETSDSGSVNSLIVLNTSDAYIFLMDGDILAGAKQNRVLNTSVLLAPHSKTMIPVSCVEQGRWHSVSDKFSTTDYAAPSSMRKMKTDNVSFSLKEANNFDANQGAVWNSVAGFAQERLVNSPTSNFSDVYEATRSNVDAAVELFMLDPEANGVMFFKGKTILHTDHFGSKTVFAHYFKKLVKGFVMEFIGTKEQKAKLGEAEAKYHAVDFIDGWEELKKVPHPGVGLGTEKRAATELYSGMQLEYNDHLIHASLFNAKSMKRARV
jgi:hypothetical protein